MNKSSDFFNFIHFADDTTIYVQGNCLDSIIHRANVELENIDKWLCCNRLSLNLNKTNFMIFSNKNSSNCNPLIIRNTVIQPVSHTKFLGIILDDKINFKQHLSSLRNKLARGCGIMYRMSSFMPPSVLRELYFTLIYPHIVYGITVWGYSSKTSIAAIRRIQNKCIKTLKNSHITPMQHIFNENRIFPIDKVCTYCVSVKFFQYFILDRSNFFLNKFSELSVIHAYPTRFSNSNNFNCPTVHIEKYRQSFYYQASKIWNSLPPNLKNCSTIYCFKKSLVRFLS